MKRSYSSSGIPDHKNSKVAKKDENVIPEPKDYLNDLLDDVFEILLTYLDINDKKNLKLVSRNCERRIIELDDSMRKWNVTFCGERSSKLATDLIQAKARHIKDSNFHLIQLSAAFKATKYFTSYFVMHEFHSNIVHLELNICGDELYLLEPAIKLVKLKSLTLKSESRMEENRCKTCNPLAIREHEKKDLAYYSKNKAAIAYATIKNHSDTLEALHLEDLNVVIDFDLNLNSFTARYLEDYTLLSVMQYSSKSLEIFTWRGETWDYSSFLSFPVVNLKEFYAIDIDPWLIYLLLESCATTIKVLSIKDEADRDDPEDIDEEYYSPFPKLKLKRLEVENCEDYLFISIMKSCSSTLEELICVSFLDKDNIVTNFLNGLPYLLNIKVLTAFSVQIRLLKTILKLSRESLTKLYLNAYLLGNVLNFSSPRLKIRKLQCNAISNYVVASILTQSASTLQELKLTILLDQSMSDIPSLNITKLSCDYVGSNITALMLKSSYKTLKELKITNSRNCTSSFPIDVKLHLQSFHCNGISDTTFNTIMAAQDSALHKLIIEKVVHGHASSCYDSVNPELITTLLKVRLNNPSSLIYVKNNKMLVSV